MAAFYTNQRLDREDQSILETFMRTLVSFKGFIEQYIQQIEIALQNRVNHEIQINEVIKVFESIENKAKGYSEMNETEFDEITNPIINVTKMNNNTIQLKNATDRIILSFLVPLQSKLSDQLYTFKNTFQLITTNLRCFEKITNKQQIIQQNSKYSQMSVWKFKSLFKDKVGFQSIVLQGEQIFAESILPLCPQILKGIYLSYIFKGTDTFKQDINSQNTEQSINLEIHEGFDLSNKIFQQNFKIKHEEFVQQGNVCNDAYKLMLRQQIYLKKGCSYSISVSGDKSRNKFYIFSHSGKDTKQNQYLLKFLNKETEQISQIVDVRTSATYSCIPGYIVQQLS